MHRVFTVLIMGMTSLSVYGQANQYFYKPGAYKDDLRIAINACKSLNTANRAQLKCMNQQGFIVVDAAKVRADYAECEQKSSKDNVLDKKSFYTCVSAKGWELQTEADKEIERLSAEYKALCESIEFKEITQHAPCASKQINLVNLSDESTLSALQKPLFIKLADSWNAYIKNVIKAMRKGGNYEQKLANYRADLQFRSEKDQLELLSGKSTWGQFNQNRKELSNDEDMGIAKFKSEFNEKNQ